jgi:hypothetical protein
VRQAPRPCPALTNPGFDDPADNDLHTAILRLADARPSRYQQVRVTEPLDRDSILRHTILHQFGLHRSGTPHRQALVVRGVRRRCRVSVHFDPRIDGIGLKGRCGRDRSRAAFSVLYISLRGIIAAKPLRPEVLGNDDSDRIVVIPASRLRRAALELIDGPVMGVVR